MSDIGALAVDLGLIATENSYFYACQVFEYELAYQTFMYKIPKNILKLNCLHTLIQ